VNLLRACPGIEPALDFSEGPYYVFHQVSRLLIGRNLEPGIEKCLVTHLNAMATEDSDTQNILVVAVMESFSDERSSVALGRTLFEGAARDLFEEMLTHFKW
jgi:hypothetical protein